MDSKESTRTHLKILNRKIISLETELQAALRESRISDERIKNLEEGLQTAESNRHERMQAMDLKYDTEFEEYNKQLKLAEETLARKKEDREDMLKYLVSLDLLEQSYDELRDFDWTSIQRLAENLSKPSDETTDILNRADDINELCEIARKNLGDINEQTTRVESDRERLRNIAEKMNTNMQTWKKVRFSQEKRIAKIQTDNEKLDLLLRQCASSNEPLSDFVTRNVHAKCQSFVNCDPNSTELLEGLRKFKNRQDKIIELLRHKDAKLCSETNKLQVACDQTHDQLNFYSQLIEQHRNMMINRTRVRQSTQALDDQLNNDVNNQDRQAQQSRQQTTITDYYAPRLN